MPETVCFLPDLLPAAATATLPEDRLSLPAFIACCTPTLGRVSIHWHAGMNLLSWPMNMGRVPITMIDDIGDCVAEARNKTVALAMQMEHRRECRVEWLFWVDDDVLVTPLALLTLLDHARNTGADVVSGCYFSKVEHGEPLSFPERFAGVKPFVPNQLFPIWGWSYGLSLVKLDVYRRMVKELKLPPDRNGLPEWHRKTQGRLGDVKQDEHGWDGGGTEDMHAMHLMHSLPGGIKALQCTERWAFGFHWDEGRRTAYPRPQWEQKKACQPVVWQTPDGEVKWE